MIGAILDLSMVPQRIVSGAEDEQERMIQRRFLN